MTNENEKQWQELVSESANDYLIEPELELKTIERKTNSQTP